MPSQSTAAGRYRRAEKKLRHDHRRRQWLKLSLVYGRTVRELQALLDAEDFAELTAFEQLDPWWKDRQDFNFACLMAQNASTKKKQYKPKDFLPKFDTQPLPDELRWKVWTMNSGGKVIDSRE